MTAGENETVNRLLTICGITEGEAKDTIFYINQTLIQEEKFKNFSPKKTGEAMSRLIAIMKKKN